MPAARNRPRRRPPEDSWQQTGSALRYRGGGMTAAAEVPAGWVSLNVGGAEFLHAGDGFGGIVFRRRNAFVTRFVGLSNLADGDMVGRCGQVFDGVYVAKIVTGFDVPRFRLYAGFNDTRDHDVVLLLNDAVGVIRCGRPDGPRYAMRTNVTRRAGRLRRTAGCVIVHDGGAALAIEDPVRVGPVRDPAGRRRLAVVWPCKGHAPNWLHLRAEPAADAGNLLLAPRLDVRSGGRRHRGDLGAVWKKDTRVELAVDFRWLGGERFDGSVALDIVHALGRRQQAERRPVTGANRRRDGHYRCALTPKLSLPGVSDVWGRLLDGSGRVLWAERFRALYDAAGYRPTYHAPADLDAFWDGTLAALRQVPLAARTRRVLRDHPDWALYAVSFNGWRGRRIYACMYIHKKARLPLPAIVGAHPGGRSFGLKRGRDGTYRPPLRRDPRFVTLQVLVRGHRPDAPNVPFNQPWWGPLDSRDEYVARDWYCAMKRAVDYLAGRPDLVDIGRVAACGGSQGGALALATAALDDRVACCLADSPSNCMLHHSVDPDTYGSFGPTAGQVPEGQTLDDLKRTLSYYDPAHLAPRITCPTAIGLNVGDMTVHSMGGLGAYKNLRRLRPSQKWFLPGCKGTLHSNSDEAARTFRRMRDRLAARKPAR
jgi:cephalosporin-C deacetylase